MHPATSAHTKCHMLMLLLMLVATATAQGPMTLAPTSQPTSPHMREPCVFNYTYKGVPAGGPAAALLCDLDGVSFSTENASWVRSESTVSLPVNGLSDGMHNLSCAVCNGTNASSICSEPRSFYSWLQLRTPPVATITRCPTNDTNGIVVNFQRALVSFELGSKCTSLPGMMCPAQAHVMWDSFCSLDTDPSKRTNTKTSSTGQDSCDLPVEWSGENVILHANAYVKGSTLYRGKNGASCNFTFQYVAPAASPAPSATSAAPAPAPPGVAPSPSASSAASEPGLSIISGPKELDTKISDLKNTDTFTYTFVLGGKDASSDTAKKYECCLQDSSKSECIFGECNFPKQEYNKALRDGLHFFRLREKSTGNETSYEFRTLRMARPNAPVIRTKSVSNMVTHDTGILLVLDNNVANPPAPLGVNPNDAALQYRFDGADDWTTAAGNFQFLNSITVSKSSGTFAVGNHTFEARTVWKSGSWFNFNSTLPTTGDGIVKSRTTAFYAWNVTEGTHVTLDVPAGIDHDCTGNQNPFFGSKDAAVCAGHVYPSNVMSLTFHSPNEIASQSYRVVHVNHGEVSYTLGECATGIPGPPDNVCASVTLTDLLDGFHSVSIVAMDGDSVLSVAPTWANWTVDTKMPTVAIDTASHPVKCDNGNFESNKCKTHLRTATFGAKSNEDSVYFYVVDPPGGTEPGRDSDLWQLAPNQIDPRPGHEGSHKGPPCHSSYAECYGAAKSIQGIHIELSSPGEHTIFIEAIDEAGNPSDTAIYTWTYETGNGYPGVPQTLRVEPASVGSAKKVKSNGGFSLPVTISWEPPIDNGGSEITNYVVTFRSTNPMRAKDDNQAYTLTAGTSTSLTTYIPEGIEFAFHVAATNQHGTGPISQPATKYRATDAGEPCSTVDCSGRGICTISSSSAGCMCLPFHSSSFATSNSVYCDIEEKFKLDEGITVGLFVNSLSNFDWERCFSSADDMGANSKEEDVLKCKDGSVSSEEAGVQVRLDPLQCSQMFDLTSAGLLFDFRHTVSGNSCKERMEASPKAYRDTLAKWTESQMEQAKGGITRKCMETPETSDCNGDYLKVVMTMKDDSTVHDHISLMLASPFARVEFEQRLGSEIHLLLNGISAEQVNVDKIDFQVMINGESSESASISGKDEKDWAKVQWRVRPAANSSDMSSLKSSIESLQSTAKPALANTRWLKTVDPSTLSVEIVKLGQVECAEDDYLCIVTHLEVWQIVLIVVGSLIVVVGVLYLVRKCFCRSNDAPHSFSKSGSGFGKGSSFRNSKGSRANHSRLYGEDDEVDLLTGGSSSQGVDIEMRSSFSSRRKNRGNNAFGL